MKEASLIRRFVKRDRMQHLDVYKRMLLKRGMGNGEWGMGNGE